MPVNVKTRNVSLTPEIEAFIRQPRHLGPLPQRQRGGPRRLRLLEEEERRRETPGQRGGHHDPPAHAPTNSKG